MPNLRDVGVLSNPMNPFNEVIDPVMAQTAQALQVALHPFAASEPAEFQGVFEDMAVKHVDGLVILDDAALIANSPTIAELALQRRLPSSAWPDFAIDGGLIAFGVNFPDEFRRAATFVDKILKGAKPANLPIERATKFETILNLKTAKAIGIEVPTSLLLRADEVIE